MKTPSIQKGDPAVGKNLLEEELSLPLAVLYEEKLAHNLAWMRRFVSAYGVHLAPHGKTTMAPALFRRQLDGGAWGITLATAHQTKVAYFHGVRRVLMANQLIGRANMAIIAELLDDPTFEFFCLVDSVDNVRSLAEFFESRNRRLNVLIELGIDGARTGCRTEEQLQDVLEAVKTARASLCLAGLELYEGVLHDAASVRSFLEGGVAAAQQISADFERNPFVLSGAGSAWFDLVAEVFGGAEYDIPVEVVLRPGCYLTHDAGLYVDAQRRIGAENSVAREIGACLLPALQVWAYVQSIPEPGLAVIGLGKRDVSFDAGLPIPALHFRPGSVAPVPAPEWRLVRMMDQHAMMTLAVRDDLQVGDMIAFDIVHPCLTFDKWRAIPVVDGDHRVIEVVDTFF